MDAKVRPQLEHWLDEQGVKWEFLESVNLTDILLDDETKLNIRMTVETDYERAMSYGISTEQGSIFPPIVIGKSVENPYAAKYNLIDGIHRIEAWSVTRKKTHSAYVVHYKSPTVLDRLRKTVNIVTGGLPLREDVRLVLAAVLVNRDMYSLVDAAKTMHVEYKKLIDKCAVDKVIETLVINKIPVAERKYTKTFLKSLQSIKSDGIKVKVAEISFKAALNAAEMETLIRELKQAKSDQERERIMERWTEEMETRIEEGKRGEIRGSMPVFRRFPSYMKKVIELTDHVEEAKLVTEAELKNTIQTCKVTIEKLKATVVKLEAMLSQRRGRATHATKTRSRRRAQEMSVGR